MYKKRLGKYVNKKRILSVEYNIAHDVIRPSIWKHFKEIGYDVDFLLAETPEKKRWNFFERVNENINTKVASYEEITQYLISKDVSNYDFIIFNTSFSFMDDYPIKDENILETIYKLTGKYPPVKYGYLTIPPHASGYVKNDKCVLKNYKLNNTYILNHVGYGGIPMLCANYFGETQITSKSKNNIFLATGNISGQKNHNLLIDAALKLDQENITNFKIIINGVGTQLEIPQNLKKYFEFVGDNKPNKLFQLIEEADFITALLDSSIEWQRQQYGHGTCSCALMHSLAFGKPLLIEDYFVKNYKLNDNNCLTYQKQDLYSAMKRAIQLKENEYLEIQQNILSDSNNRTLQTLQELPKYLKYIKSKSLQQKIKLKLKELRWKPE